MCCKAAAPNVAGGVSPHIGPKSQSLDLAPQTTVFQTGCKLIRGIASLNHWQRLSEITSNQHRNIAKEAGCVLHVLQKIVYNLVGSAMEG